MRDVKKKKSNLAADTAQFALLFHSKKKCGPFLFNTHPSRLEWKAKLTACKGSHRNPPTQKPAYVMVESNVHGTFSGLLCSAWLENLQDLFLSFLFFFFHFDFLPPLDFKCTLNTDPVHFQQTVASGLEEVQLDASMGCLHSATKQHTPKHTPFHIYIYSIYMYWKQRLNLFQKWVIQKPLSRFTVTVVYRRINALPALRILSELR